MFLLTCHFPNSLPNSPPGFFGLTCGHFAVTSLVKVIRPGTRFTSNTRWHMSHITTLSWMPWDFASWAASPKVRLALQLGQVPERFKYRAGRCLSVRSVGLFRQDRAHCITSFLQGCLDLLFFI